MYMVRHKIRFGKNLVNGLIAVVISLIVNFSYLVYMILAARSTVRPHGYGMEHYTSSVIVEALFYAVMAFVLLGVFTWRFDASRASSRSYGHRLLLALVLAGCFYFEAPFVSRYGELRIVLLAQRIVNPMVLLKISFTLVVAALYGKIYELIVRQQQMSLENERLKTENLRSRYDVLVTQMNPHFFFNSLNSLAMLVREERTADALTYIDRLSETFRYVIRSGRNMLTPLRDELAFLEGYKYLLEVRYAGKLFIETRIPADCMDRLLPALSLQPLIENAVKHNTITRTKPLRVTIQAEGDMLSVSNPIQPKIDDSEQGTGIGLKNLASRYRLLTDREIAVSAEQGVFVVRLPLEERRREESNPIKKESACE